MIRIRRHFVQPTTRKHPFAGLWVWAAFRIPGSPKPFLMSQNLKRVIGILRRRAVTRAGWRRK